MYRVQASNYNTFTALENFVLYHMDRLLIFGFRKTGGPHIFVIVNKGNPCARYVYKPPRLALLFGLILLL